MTSDACEALAGVHDRIEAYCDRRVRAVARALLGKRGPAGLLELSALTGMDSGGLSQLLEKLTGSGFLTVRERVYRAAIKDTGETEFQARLSCPSCGSPDMVREELLEHTVCGFTGKTGEFKRRDGRLVCPSCGQVIGEGELKVLGYWYLCRSCGHTTPKPDIVLIGLRSGKEAKVDELIPVSEAKYWFPAAIEREAELLVPALDGIESVLGEKGYSLREARTVKGASGMDHEFCFVAEGSGKTVALDVAVICGEKGISEALKSLTKAYDSSFSDATVVLIAVPEPPAHIAQMLMSGTVASGRFKLVFAESPEKLPDKLREAL